jgi:hypothetical protein
LFAADFLSGGRFERWVPRGISDLVFGIGFALIPATAGIAMLCFRLYDIDRLINHSPSGIPRGRWPRPPGRLGPQGPRVTPGQVGVLRVLLAVPQVEAEQHPDQGSERRCRSG